MCEVCFYLTKWRREVLFFRHHEIPITPPKLSQYTLALSSLCQDPRQFHGHDLIGTLQHHEPIQDLDFAYASLSVCSARAHLRRKQIRRLLDIANNAKDHNIGDIFASVYVKVTVENSRYVGHDDFGVEMHR